MNIKNPERKIFFFPDFSFLYIKTPKMCHQANTEIGFKAVMLLDYLNTKNQVINLLPGLT